MLPYFSLSIANFLLIFFILSKEDNEGFKSSPLIFSNLELASHGVIVDYYNRISRGYFSHLICLFSDGSNGDSVLFIS